MDLITAPRPVDEVCLDTAPAASVRHLKIIGVSEPSSANFGPKAVTANSELTLFDARGPKGLHLDATDMKPALKKPPLSGFDLTLPESSFRTAPSGKAPGPVSHIKLFDLSARWGTNMGPKSVVFNLESALSGEFAPKFQWGPTIGRL
jgi:hypothetical protein